MRWLSKYQGAITHSRLDRAVIARYFAFLVISQLVIFTLIGVIFSPYPHFLQFRMTDNECSLQTLSRKSSTRLANTRASRRSLTIYTVSTTRAVFLAFCPWNVGLPDTINRTYIDQASYWLTYFPLVVASLNSSGLYTDTQLCSLRGFLVFFDLAQIINLVFIMFKKQSVTLFASTMVLALLTERSCALCSFLGRTPREIREWTQPPEFQYAIYL
jgi:calcium permeable stress-gated cation channel